MSWKATAWAKETRGHKGYGQKLVLMILADYHNTEPDHAWPSQATLSRDCEMPERTVRHELHNLEADGFITTLRKGNQHQPTLYRLNFGVTAPICEPARSEPATIAAASEPAISTIVNRQWDASEPATPRMTNLHEPPIEPTISIQGEDQGFSENGVLEVWPDWYSTLWAIPGFKIPLPHARQWLAKQGHEGISEERANITAYSLKSKWPGDPKKPYTDPWATFQNWVKRPPLQTMVGRGARRVEPSNDLSRYTKF